MEVAPCREVTVHFIGQEARPAVEPSLGLHEVQEEDPGEIKQPERVAVGVPSELLRRRLNLRKQYIVIYLGRAYAQIPLVRFTRLVLELEGTARQRALAKIQKLEQSLLNPQDDTS